MLSVSRPTGTPRSAATRRTPIPRSTKRGTDAGREIVGAVLDDADDLTTDVAQPEDCYADHLFVTGHGSPHFQTQQIIDRLPAQDQAGTASAHRHHRGTADHVVTARQRITIGAGSGHPEQVTGL